jgi:RNA polymerase sigma factor for flagellar operon FliA
MNPSVLPSAPCERSIRLLEHRPLVRQIANRLRSRMPASVGMDELVQAGMIGLNEALTRFEEGRGASFGTYASRRIEGSMLDALRASDEMSRDARARQRQIRTAVQALEHRLGRAPRAKEVALELGWTLEDFYKVMVEAGAAPTRLEDEALEWTEDEASSRADRDDDSAGAAIDEHADPQRVMQMRQRHAALAKAVEGLDERERRVMEMIYANEMTLAEIGAELGVTASRVSRIHEAIVSKLRLRMRAW